MVHLIYVLISPVITNLLRVPWSLQRHREWRVGCRKHTGSGVRTLFRPALVALLATFYFHRLYGRYAAVTIPFPVAMFGEDH